MMTITLEDVLKFRCPDCSARPFTNCRGPDTQGKAHLLRWAVARGKPVRDPRSIECPKCGVGPGKDCLGPRDTPMYQGRIHAERATAFRRQVNVQNKRQS